KHTRRFNALVAAHFDNRLCRHQDFRDLILEIGVPDTRLQTVAYLFLVTRVRMKNKPLQHSKTLFLRRGPKPLLTFRATNPNPKSSAIAPGPPRKNKPQKRSPPRA